MWMLIYCMRDKEFLHYYKAKKQKKYNKKSDLMVRKCSINTIDLLL